MLRLLAVVVACCLTAHSVDASRHVLTSVTITSDLTIQSPTDVIEWTGVTFTGSIQIVLNLASMTASPFPLWITMCNCKFQNGANLYFSSSASQIDNNPPMNVYLEECSFISGAIGFYGYFPQRTRIVMSSMTVMINSRAALLQNWNLGHGDGRMAYCMVFYAFNLRKYSSVLITNSFLGGTWPGGSGTSANAEFPITTVGGFYLSDHSTVVLQSTRTTLAFVFHVHDAIIVSQYSALVFYNNTMQCDRFCLSFDNTGEFTFSSYSVFLIDSNVASVPLGAEGEDLFMSRANPTQFLSGSLFLVRDNNLSPYRYAFNFQVTLIIDNSIMSMYDNTLQGTPFRMTVQPQNGGLALAQCNNNGGVELRRVDQYQTAGLNGLTAAYGCARGTSCSYQNVTCYMPGSSGLTATCDCRCNSVGVGRHCLPTITPIFQTNCYSTLTLGHTESKTMSYTEHMSESLTRIRVTSSIMDTRTVSTSQSQAVSQSSTYNGTVSVPRRKLNSRSHVVTATPTHKVTPDVTSTASPTSRPSRTVTFTASVTSSVTGSLTGVASLTLTQLPTITKSLPSTLSDSSSATVTASSIPSATKSVSFTASLSTTQATSKSRTGTATLTTRTTTVTESVLPLPTLTVDPHSFTFPHTDTMTFVPSPTNSRTLTRTPSASPSTSRSATLSRTGSVSATVTLTVTATKTRSVTQSHSASATVTLTQSTTNTSVLTLTKTKSISRSRSDCDWFTLGIVPTAPLVLTPEGNNTMSIDYLTALEFGENFTLTGLGQWYITRTTFVGESSGVNSTTAPDGTTASIVSGKVPQFYSPETGRTVVIRVTFRCAVVDHSEFYTIVIDPLPPVLAAAALETLIRLTSLASVLSVSPAAAAAAALSLIMQQIMLCRPLYENSAVSLAGWAIGEGDPRYLRGALATNALVVLGEVVIVMIFAVVVVVYSKSRLNMLRFWRVMEMLQWPHVMHITISALLQLSTTAAVSLISITKGVEDGVAAFVAVSFCFSYTCWICKQCYITHRDMKSSMRKWNVAQGLTTTGFVFGDYSKPWFVAIETTAFFVVGVVAGIPPSLEICLIQMFVILFASLFIIAMLAWHKPYKTRIGLGFAILVHSFISMAALSLIIGHFTRNPTSPYAFSSFCLLFIPVAALLRGGWDVWSTMKNAKSWWDKAVTAQCLEDMPWEEEDDYEDAISSEDEEMLNFGVAAPISEKLDDPLLMLPPPPPPPPDADAKQPTLPPNKKRKGKGKAAETSDTTATAEQQNMVDELFATAGGGAVGDSTAAVRVAPDDPAEAQTFSRPGGGRSSVAPVNFGGEDGNMDDLFADLGR